MIKFFRKIRQNLLSEGKTRNYLKYVFGEIILVMVGILLALQVNNWNESKKQSKKELSLLLNLKNDINIDIINLKHQDSVFSVFEADAALGIELFYKAKTVKDINSVINLTKSLWNVLYINNITYNEMISSGNMYAMKNKDLQKQITTYYLNVEGDKNYINEVNNEQAYLYNRMPEFYPFKFLTSQFKNPKIDLNLIDTTWINNPNSATYLALENYLNTNQETNNVYRRSVYKRNIEYSKKLLANINKELEIRNK